MRSMSQSVGKPPRLVSKLVEKWLAVCILCPILGVAYMSVIILPDYNEPTRISENALLPALVTEHFAHSQRIVAFAKALHVHKIFYEPFRDRAQYVKSQLELHGITAQLQSYEIAISGHNESRTNVYGLARASRSPSVESILVAVALDSERVEAAALTLALATYCREQLYWARDLIFVFVNGGTLGMEAFLAAYHGETRTHLKFDLIRDHGGSIIGAIAVKTTGSSFSDLDIEFNMMNGQLPNLDLVNLMVRLADKFGLTPTVFGSGYQSTWGDIAETVMKAIFAQAFVNGQGLHSVFGSYGIQAVTIHAKGSSGHVSLAAFARICEGALRSLNNILEKFHQSYFLYILPNARRFISVAYYMPAIGIMILPLLVLALREWFSMAKLSLSNSYLIFHLIGIALYFVGSVLAPQNYRSGFSVHLLLLLIPYYLLFPTKQETVGTTKFFFFLELALLISSVALMNFSLAYLVSLVAVPVAIIFSTVNMRKLNWLKGVFGFLIHPIVMFVAVRVMVVARDEPVVSAVEMLNDSMIQSYLLLSNIMFPLLQICLIPLWSILLHFSCTQSL